jgi:hypothetical protein
MVQDMHSFLYEYFSTKALALHANRCHAAQVEQSQGPAEKLILVPIELVGLGRSIRQAPEYFVVE